MAESKPAAPTSDLGVVDPIRIPGVDLARRLWADLPQLSRIFVALTVADIVVRALGLFGTILFIIIEAPETWLTAFLPHNALILLPAVIAYRSPNALTELPIVTRGALAIALVELLKDPVRTIVEPASADGLLFPVLVGTAVAFAVGLGWFAIGSGLRVFASAQPSQSVAGLANLVGGAIAFGAIVSATGAVVAANLDMGDPGSTLLVRGSNAAVSLSGLGLAYLAWVVIRGSEDPDRPARAIKLATASLVAIAVGAVLTPFMGGGILWLALALITHTFALTGLVVAFGLGLADEGRLEIEEPPPDDGPSWPEPDDPASWPQPVHRPNP